MKWIYLLLTLVNFVLLVPGVTLPIYGVHITTEVQASIVPEPVEVTVYEETRSILSTIAELWQSSDYLVSFLILLFSIIVPVTKAATLLSSLYVRTEAVRRRLVGVVNVIGKWSMADVYVVAIFLAYLATRDQGQVNSFEVAVPFLPTSIEVGMETHLTSTLGPGFYYFLAYCLFSVLWTQILLYANRGQPSPFEARGS